MTDLERYDDLKRRLEELRLKWIGHAQFLESAIKESVGSMSFNETILADEVNAGQVKIIRTLQGELYDAINNENPIV